MQKSINDLTKEIDLLEAYFNEGLKSCHRLRGLIQAGVSTPAAGQAKLDRKAAADIVLKRRNRINATIKKGK